METSSHQRQRNDLVQTAGSRRRNFVRLIGQRIALTITLVFALASSATAQPAVEERLEKAAILIRENRIAEAEQQLNGILKTAPNEPVALNLLGTVRAQQGRVSEAEALLIRSAAIDPSYVAVRMNLAFLYMLRNAPEKTISELKEVVKLDPKNIEANYKLGRLLLARDQVDDSIAILERAKAEVPASIVFLPLLGDAYLKNGNAEKAEENYLLALAAQKDNPDAVLGLAKVSQKRGDARAALDYLAKARELAGNTPELRYKVGVAALALGTFDDAQTDLEQAVKLKPDDPLYLIALGAAWLKKSDLIVAEQIFRRALELQPQNSQAEMYLGYVLYKQKKFSEARGFLEKTIIADSTVPESFYYLGLIVQEENEDERAITLLERAVQMSPTFANAHVALGASYLKLKDYVRARKELELGVRLNPDDSKAHYQLAVLYARLKDPKRAQAEMAIVEKLKTGDQSQKKEGDTFAVMPAVPDGR
jgi:tetratricopeptide (TPR) repeat protein